MYPILLKTMLVMDAPVLDGKTVYSFYKKMQELIMTLQPIGVNFFR
jgi:hypothetical protein